MSLESQVLQLKAKHAALDDAFHEYHRIVQGTQDVVALMIKEQREYHGKTDYRLDRLEHSLSEFKREVRKNFKQLELLITQLHPNHQKSQVGLESPDS